MSVFIQNARTALDSASVLRKLGDTKGALSRAYYGAFDAVRAALSTIDGVDVDAIKTHRGLEQLFHLHFVKRARLEKDAARQFSILLELRGLADYGREPPPLPEADAGIEAAALLIAAVEQYLAGLQGGQP